MPLGERDLVLLPLAVRVRAKPNPEVLELHPLRCATSILSAQVRRVRMLEIALSCRQTYQSGYERDGSEISVLEMQSELLHPSSDPSLPVLEPIMENLPPFLISLDGHCDQRQSGRCIRREETEAAFSTPCYVRIALSNRRNCDTRWPHGRKRTPL